MTTPASIPASAVIGADVWPAKPVRAQDGQAGPAPTAACAPVCHVTRRARTRAKVMSVASGKGGVGKTNIAANIAIGLARAGRRTLLLDADLGLANIDLILGRQTHGDLGHALDGRLSLDRVVHEGPGGLHWIPGPSGLVPVCPTGAGRDVLLARLAAMETEYDFVILDAPAGIGRVVLHLVRQSDEVVLVTTPEPAAIMDAYALLKAARAGSERIARVRSVINMASSVREGQRVHRRLAETARRFLGLQVERLGVVLADGHVVRAVQARQPVLEAFPNSVAARCIRQLVATILEGSARPAAARPGFFRRLANLFGGDSR